MRAYLCAIARGLTQKRVWVRAQQWASRCGVRPHPGANPQFEVPLAVHDAATKASEGRTTTTAAVHFEGFGRQGEERGGGGGVAAGIGDMLGHDVLRAGSVDCGACPWSDRPAKMRVSTVGMTALVLPRGRGDFGSESLGQGRHPQPVPSMKQRLHASGYTAFAEPMIATSEPDNVTLTRTGDDPSSHGLMIELRAGAEVKREIKLDRRIFRSSKLQARAEGSSDPWTALSGIPDSAVQGSELPSGRSRRSLTRPFGGKRLLQHCPVCRTVLKPGPSFLPLQQAPS